MELENDETTGPKVAGSRLWLRHFAERPATAPVAYCFPFAGGSAGAYKPLASHFPHSIDVAGVQLPGRADRIREPARSDLRQLAGTLADAVAEDAGERPFAFFGHSMGALLAFETARELRARGAAGPRTLVVTGSHAPQLPSDTTSWADLPGEELVRKLRGLGGLPPEVEVYPQLLELVMETTRSDLALIGSYRYTESTPLDCPLVVLGGDTDPGVPRADLEAWAAVSRQRPTVGQLPGGHFFINDHLAHVAGLVAAPLTPDRDGPGREPVPA